MEVITLQDKAFYALVEEVVHRLKATEEVENNKWISDVEAMRCLNIKSKTTLQKLREELQAIQSTFA